MRFSKLSVFVFLCLNCEGLTDERRYVFYHKVEQNSVTQYDTITLQAKSRIDCARECQLEKCACFSYSNEACSIGKCDLAANTSGGSQEIYVSCYGNDGFNFITIGSASACVWVSTNATSYMTARDDCRAKDAHLYTVKTMEKLTWLQSNYNSMSLWIGLNDIDVEGTYRWEDDNTVCSQSWINQTFATGEPNNHFYPGGNYDEDCISFFYSVPLLNDAPCVSMNTYICEKPFFNFP
ncbi:brevican core protein-like [Biomphalaria glabrata]|uniref:Brevican core protein-like n=1 Tax=Biomphalaria glabrata TaxID=6526 RepID=A0A9W3B602_BIOGL|nr:brevican core protein-like [Biomphalaria glabrata]KAI8757182.1 C-type lectin domain family 4 member M-like [Biomphalaria glabrata]